jgi:hypothetical protein
MLMGRFCPEVGAGARMNCGLHRAASRTRRSRRTVRQRTMCGARSCVVDTIILGFRRDPPLAAGEGDGERVGCSVLEVGLSLIPASRASNASTGL